MNGALEALDQALSDANNARRRVGARKSTQVSVGEETDYLKAIAYSWFRSHRSLLGGRVTQDYLRDVDAPYRRILDSTEIRAARRTYLRALSDAKKALVSLRGEILTVERKPPSPASDPAPDFSPLVGDEEMKSILRDRWGECQRCLGAHAFLAATVMMGGLLEALFVAKANQMGDKSPLFKAKAAPRDRRTSNPLPLSEWTLRPYIDVGFEIGWITRPGKDVAAVLRDYRNYVHPEKQRSHGVRLQEQDALMFWDITRNLAVQLLGFRSSAKA
jgi:hypothetical protein